MRQMVEMRGNHFSSVNTVLSALIGRQILLEITTINLHLAPRSTKNC